MSIISSDPSAFTTTIDASGRFHGSALVSAGQQSVEIKATDASGNVTTKQAQVTAVAGSPNQTLTYDLNGNLTGDGVRTFTWDAENRLTGATVGGHSYTWSYNGAWQRTTESLDGTLTKQWVSSDKVLKLELDASNVVTKHFYPQGMVTGSTLPAAPANNFYYTRDHLGSIREVTSSAGVLLARYDYDPYGRRTKLSGTFEADFGFTGHYIHPSTGLHMTYYRAYDGDLARWLSRDPIGENGGLNLYGYVGNSPTSKADPLGLIVGVDDAAELVIGGVAVGVTAVAAYCGYTPAKRAMASIGGYFSSPSQVVPQITQHPHPAAPSVPQITQSSDYVPSNRDRKTDKNDRMGGEDPDPLRGKGPKKGTPEYYKMMKRIHDIKKSCGRGGADNIDSLEPKGY